MPTSTATHDVQLEVLNDSAWPVTVRIVRDAGARLHLGPSIVVSVGENLPLVISTGTLYRYVVERDVNARIRAVEMTCGSALGTLLKTRLLKVVLTL